MTFLLERFCRSLLFDGSIQGLVQLFDAGMFVAITFTWMPGRVPVCHRCGDLALLGAAKEYGVLYRVEVVPVVCFE